ncbi:MAG: hypothetical protein ACTS2F_03540 [Thainema sp.]
MTISITNTIAILISNKRQSSVQSSPWNQFLSWVIHGKDHPDIESDDVSKDSLNPSDNSDHQDINVTQETCAYCSFYEFGWCTFHGKSVASDSEICNEIKCMQ